MDFFFNLFAENFDMCEKNCQQNRGVPIIVAKASVSGKVPYFVLCM